MIIMFSQVIVSVALKYYPIITNHRYLMICSAYRRLLINHQAQIIIMNTITREIIIYALFVAKRAIPMSYIAFFPLLSLSIMILYY